MSEILCENLSIGYENKPILSNLTFKINTGNYLCILGENGAGKSTLVKTLIKLLKPISGEIKVGEKNKIGYLPQQSLIQRDFPASVYEVVVSGCLENKLFKPFFNFEDKEKAYFNMNKMNIETLAKKSFKELSGGQQQRVLLARALCAGENILLLDEPVSGLDPKATKEMYDIIKYLNEEEKVTIVMVSHDVESSIKDASHILYIGKDYFFGTKEEYISSKFYKI
ncbi:MAG: metal ABC transporter ATP-binding protein [Lachnospirales bacterium]